MSTLKSKCDIICRKYTVDRKHKMCGILSEIDGPLDFDEILVNGSVLNVVSMDISFLPKSFFKKLSAFKVIYFVCNIRK